MEAETDIKDFQRSEITIGNYSCKRGCISSSLNTQISKDVLQMRVNLFEDSSANLELPFERLRLILFIGPPPKESLNIICEDIWQEQYMLIVPSEIMK